jgi:anti-sigma factor RsiW
MLSSCLPSKQGRSRASSAERHVSERKSGSAESPALLWQRALAAACTLQRACTMCRSMAAVWSGSEVINIRLWHSAYARQWMTKAWTVPAHVNIPATVPRHDRKWLTRPCLQAIMQMSCDKTRSAFQQSRIQSQGMLAAYSPVPLGLAGMSLWGQRPC